jgi:aconitate hydratase
MGLTIAQKIIKAHLVEGEMSIGQEIGIRIDQCLQQDATGTMVMLELEAMNLPRVKTDVSVQYVDHNLVQNDYKNADDHLFLLSASQRFGFWYSRPGNGVSHPVHYERFGKPGATMLGSDSHTPAAGGMGMLAIGAGGIDVAMANAGEPFFFKMPKIWGVKLTGELPDWVSSKDIILEMLRRHDVKGGLGCIIEYYGPGIDKLTAMDRHVICNMGAELGATTSLFPSDAVTKDFLRSQGREADWTELLPDADAVYDRDEHIELSELVPLIAMPQSPGNVKTVSEVAGERIYQSYIGSSANPEYRALAMASEVVKNKSVASHVSFDINPASRQILENIVHDGYMTALIHSGARIHQAGCNGCIGMGQAPATHEISVRTVPRNFPGRSGTKEDKVCLVSPETAVASAVMGVITDPRTLDMPYPRIEDPHEPRLNTSMLLAPLPEAEAKKVQLRVGPNISSLPLFDELPDRFEVKVLLKMGDNITTDHISPAGSRVLPFRSNIPKIAEFSFELIDQDYPKNALSLKEQGGHAIVAGFNYGQGSSREHAALAPRYLGLRIVLVKDFARIHWQNLINFGILPLQFDNDSDYDAMQNGDVLRVENVHSQIKAGNAVEVWDVVKHKMIQTHHTLSPRQVEVLLKGGLINWVKAKHS